MMKELRFIFLLSIWKAILFVQAQNEYISLNCGLPEGSTSLDEIGYTYTADHSYIYSGEIEKVATQFTSSASVMYQTLRSFPRYRRNCYTLTPVMKGKKYLIRASFMYGNYDGQNLLPTFDLYLGVEPWDTVKLDNATHILWTEIIATAQSSNISVCLIKTTGVNPFVSALELRPADDIYNNTEWSPWLKTYMRINAGSNGPSRFKEDTADRTWTPDYSGYGSPTSTTTRIERTGTFRVPSMVLQTAEYSRTSINISWSSAANGKNYFFILYFSGIVLNRDDNLTLNINGQRNMDFPVPYMGSYSIRSDEPVGGNYLIAVTGTNLTSVPLISAFEVYKAYEPTGGATYGQDVDAITAIRDYYQIRKNWASDPCLPQPYPWEGVNCSYGNPMSPTITGLDLSNSELQGSISTKFEDFKSIRSLNLSGNHLKGPIPAFLGTMKSLQTLDLSDNDLHGPIPSVLKARMDNGSLSVRLNNIGLDTPCCHKRNVKWLVVAICVPVAVILIIIAIICIVRLNRNRRHTYMPEPHPTTVVPNLPVPPHPPSLAPTVPFVPPPHVPGQENRFSYSDIVQMTNNFQTVIGRGGCGTVYLGQLRHDRQVAVKKVTRTEALRSKEFAAEIASLTQVHHRNLVSFYGFCDEGVHMMVVYEYMAGGNLWELLSDKSKKKSMFLRWDKRLQMAISVSTGLDYLHTGCNPPIIHRDVKTTNILLDANTEARLSDFGLSRAISAENVPVSTLVAGTTGYIDPEYYKTGKLTTKSDVYSFGVVLFELITGRHAFFFEDGIQTSVVKWAKTIIQYGDFHRIVDPRLKGQYDADSMWDVIELAIECLQESGDRRPTMQMIVTRLVAAKNQEMRRVGIGIPTSREGSIPSEVSMDSTTNVETETAPMPR